MLPHALSRIEIRGRAPANLDKGDRNTEESAHAARSFIESNGKVRMFEGTLRKTAPALFVAMSLAGALGAQIPPVSTPSPTPTPPAEAPRSEASPEAPESAVAAAPATSEGDFLPLPDRWRIGTGEWGRLRPGRAIDPYNRNPLKGDYPIFGKTFLSLTALSDTIGEEKRLPILSGPSAQNPDREEFFGKGELGSFVQELLVSASLFHGDAGFKPRDWEVRATAVANLNYLHAEENGVVDIDVTRGNTRTDHFVGMQELFAEVRLATLSPSYDFVSVRAGIQGFTSDFRGFVFSDNNEGVRFFGNFASNRVQWNLAAFDMLEKDTNSGLNTFHTRGQRVGVANLYIQDFLIPGYTTELSFLYNDDKASVHYDENGFLVRPGLIGDVAPHALHVGYLGWTGEGHIGRLNVSHAFYEAYGTDDHNPIAGRRTKVDAQMAALELSADIDWWRPILSFFWASGDAKPTDGTARGFSSIFENARFAGGPFSFWQRQSIPLSQTGLKLVNGNSLTPDLRSSRDEGQANYVSPGILLAGLQFDVKVTPKLDVIVNANALRFDHTETLELLLFQPDIHKDVGLDTGLGIKWRPDLNQQIEVLVGAALFTPGRGFRDIYSSRCDAPCGAKAEKLYQAFASLVFAY